MRPFRIILLCVALSSCGAMFERVSYTVDKDAIQNTRSSLYPVYGRSFWRPVVEEYVAGDLENPPPKCARIFVGSSTIKKWPNLETTFDDKPVVQRGVGGATIQEITYFFDELILSHSPSEIVFYAGENDLTFRIEPQEAFENFVDFMNIKSRKLGDVPVWFIGTKPSPMRFDQFFAQIEFDRKVKNLANDRADLVFVDLTETFLSEEGKPKSVFQEDGLHLNDEGYALLENALLKAFESYKSERDPIVCSECMPK